MIDFKLNYRFKPVRQCLHVHHFGFLTLTVKTLNFETKLRRPFFNLLGILFMFEREKKQLFIRFVLKYLDKML